MRRSVLRRSVTLAILAVAFAGWCAFFHGQIPFRPKYEFATGIEQRLSGIVGSYLEVEYVSEDGKNIVSVNRTVAPFIWSGHRNYWDAARGKQVEETRTKNAGWQVLHELAGQTFYRRDTEHWDKFLRRWRDKRPPKNANQQAQEAPDGEWEFPSGCTFSDDGRFFAYPRSDLLPVLNVPKGQGFDILVEEVDTGRVIATIPDTVADPQFPFVVGPGGRYAAKVVPQEIDDRHVRHLVIWDLSKNKIVSQTPMPASSFAPTRFTNDGQFILAYCGDCPEPMTAHLICFDLSGTQRGVVGWHGRSAISDDGKTLIDFQMETEGNGRDGGSRYVFEFRDIHTGEELGDWVFPVVIELTLTDRIAASLNGRYFGIAYEAERTQSFWARHPSWPKPPWFPLAKQGRMEEDRFLVLDTTKREVVGCVPARSGAFSANNRWLATVDRVSVIRVWDLPFRKPWGRILGYSALATLASWLLVLIATRVFPRRKPAAPAKP